MIQCGSTSLTDRKSRYSIMDIKLLGVVLGMQKCLFYTKGTPHIMIFSDHSALTSLSKKELVKIENIRLVTMLERLGDFNYEIRHLARAKNAAADYLYNQTVSSGQAPEFSKGRMSVKVRTVRSPSSPEDASLWKVAEATSSCQSTLKIIEAIKKR